MASLVIASAALLLSVASLFFYVRQLRREQRIRTLEYVSVQFDRLASLVHVKRCAVWAIHRSSPISRVIPLMRERRGFSNTCTRSTGSHWACIHDLFRRRFCSGYGRPNGSNHTGRNWNRSYLESGPEQVAVIHSGLPLNGSRLKSAHPYRSRGPSRRGLSSRSPNRRLGRISPPRASSLGLEGRATARRGAHTALPHELS